MFDFGHFKFVSNSKPKSKKTRMRESRSDILCLLWIAPWNRSQIVDSPFLGFYNSCDPNTCRQHIIWMEDIGIDFVIISWWGANSGNLEFEFKNNAVKVLFENAKNYASKVQLAIMVEPSNETVNGYDYVYENFIQPYPTVYFQYRGKPLICFFCDVKSPYLMRDNTYPRDPRFTVINLGSLIYAEWLYESYSPFWQGSAPRCKH